MPLLAARGVEFRVTSLYDKMAAARVVLSDHMSQLHSEEICFHRARMICDEKMHALNGNDISHYQSSQSL